jgi:hypothetical protein
VGQKQILSAAADRLVKRKVQTNIVEMPENQGTEEKGHAMTSPYDHQNTNTERLRKVGE